MLFDRFLMWQARAVSRFFKKTGMQAVSRSLFRGGIPEEGAEIVQISAPKS
ncbi:hypothetical protein O59_000106 [Cellvibrio sp. BR]|jgi:hypothetical protein|nr:hypothetical protein O59_000106 [Cellvibrio sp. BR]